ncbi:MAG: hypothetical protein M3070_10560 [Actinomycetota bacterium]|nr:hypothetical protein [Actinomycetota bacterium]
MMKGKLCVLERLPAAKEVLEAAQRLVLNDRFAPTTIAAIAEGARVSVATDYEVFGGKPSLVRTFWEQALARHGPVPAQAALDALPGRR